MEAAASARDLPAPAPDPTPSSSADHAPPTKSAAAATTTVHDASGPSKGARPSVPRSSKACVRCASIKKKCDALYPRCSPCSKANAECLYVDSGRRRGRPSAKTVAERAAAAAAAAGAAAAPVAGPSAGSTGTGTSAPPARSSAPGAHAFSISLDGHAAFGGLPGPSDTCAHPATAVSLAPPADDSRSALSSPHVDPPSPPDTSAVSFAMAEASRIRQHLYERSRETSQYLRESSQPPAAESVDGECSASPGPDPASSTATAAGGGGAAAAPAGGHGPAPSGMAARPHAYRPDPHKLSSKVVGHYFDIYRRHMHSHWPFLYWPAISLIPEQDLARDVPDPLFSAVVCLGATLAASASGKPEDRAYAVALSEHSAQQTLSSLAVRRPPITVLQALLLHSIRFYGAGDLRRAWRFSSSASQLAVDMGLYRAQPPAPPSKGEPGPSLRQAQLRALWCCFCLEKVLCAETDRPPMFRNDLIQAPPVSEIESDEFEPLFLHSVLMPDSSRSQTLGPLHAASSLNLTARIYQVLEQILLNQMATQQATSALLSPPTGNSPGTGTGTGTGGGAGAGATSSPATAGAIEMQVASWARCIELDQKLNEVASSWPERFRLSRHGRPAVPGVVCLVIWFHLCKIINFRPFILMKELPAAAAAAAGIPHTISAVAATACLASASAIVQLFETIADSGLRFIAGNNALAIFTAASVLLPYSTHDSLLPVMVHECKHGVRRCLTWLAEMAVTWPIAEKHKRALEEVAAQLPVDLGPPIPNPPRSLSESGVHAASPTAPMPMPPPTPQRSAASTGKRKRAPSKDRSHHKATSPLGFGGELANRPFSVAAASEARHPPPSASAPASASASAPAPAPAPTSASPTSASDDRPPPSGSALGSGSGAGAGSGDDWAPNTHHLVSNSMYDELLSWLPMPADTPGTNGGTNGTTGKNGASSANGSAQAPPSSHSVPRTSLSPLSQPLRAAPSGAPNPSETLALDSDIQALIRQSLNRDTALWDSAVPREVVDVFDPALYSFS